MKTISALLFASIALAQNAVSQTPAPAKPHPAPVVKSAAPTAKPAAPTPTGCVKLPALSPKIPALPPGSPCFKPLYTITPIPTATLSYISPIEDPHLRDVLGISLPENINLSYVDTKIGDGALVVPRKWYTIKYAGYLTDGTEFDASDKHPEIGGTFSFPQGQHQVVIGMDTGLDGMRVGGKRRLFIPWILAYRDQPHLSIPAKSDLIFDIELVSQSDTDPTPKAAATPVTAPASSTAPAAAPATTPAAAPATTPLTTAPPQPSAPKP